LSQTTVPTEVLVQIPLNKIYRLLNHCPLVLVSTTDGRLPNAAPISWCMPMDLDPPRMALCMSRDHRTYANLRATGDVVLNIPTTEMLDTIMFLGSHSGHEMPDKLAQAGIASLPSKKVVAPRLAGCLAWIEAVVVELNEDAPDNPLIVEARYAEAVDGFMDAAFVVHVERFPALHHLGGTRFLVGREIMAASASTPESS
jgi:flavin reductase (DIM6/NTAB) family NADH-FMN oxidoreductase RutF